MSTYGSTQGPVRTVSFDAFGTLVRIGRPRRPFAQLLACLRAEGVALPGDVRTRVMSNPWDLRACAQALGLPPSRLDSLPWDRLNDDLVQEADSVRAFDESLDVLHRLRDRGYRLAIVSNLALPYVAMVRTALPGLVFDVERWSCLAGATKPDPGLMASLGAPGEAASTVVHVGDTWSDDVEGAQRAGVRPVFLARTGVPPSRAVDPTVPVIARLTGMLDLLPDPAGG